MKLGLGTHHLENARILEIAYTLGIRHFDTAGVYGFGKSETLIGQVLKGADVEIATKIGQHWEPVDVPLWKRPRFNLAGRFADWRPSFLTEAFARSLERLRVDEVDVLYLHNPPVRMIRPFEIGGTKAIGFSVGKNWHVVPAVQHGVCQCPPGWMLEGAKYVVREPLGRGLYRHEARKRLEALRDDPRVDLVLVGTNDIHHLRENVEIFR